MNNGSRARYSIHTPLSYMCGYLYTSRRQQRRYSTPPYLLHINFNEVWELWQWAHCTHHSHTHGLDALFPNIARVQRRTHEKKTQYMRWTIFETILFRMAFNCVRRDVRACAVAWNACIISTCAFLRLHICILNFIRLELYLSVSLHKMHNWTETTFGWKRAIAVGGESPCIQHVVWLKRNIALKIRSQKIYVMSTVSERRGERASESEKER